MLTICFFPSVPGTYARLRLLLCWLFIIISSGGGSGVYMNVCVCVLEWAGVLAAAAWPERPTTRWLGSPPQHCADLRSVAVCQTGRSQTSGRYECNLKQLWGYFNLTYDDRRKTTANLILFMWLNVESLVVFGCMRNWSLIMCADFMADQCVLSFS